MSVEAQILSPESGRKGKGQIAKVDEGSLPAPSADTTALMRMIERIISDPSMSIEQAFDFYQRVEAEKRRAEAETAKQNFVAAFVKAQHEMEPVQKDASNPQTRSKYASYDALERALRPIYTKHGFGVSFDVGENAPPDHVRVLCFVQHQGGHERIYHLDMPADGKGAKGGDVMTKTHAMGSALSYGKRYLMGNVWNVVSTEKDDDGNAAGNTSALVSADQATMIEQLIQSTGTDQEHFLKWAKVESVWEIKARDFDRIEKLLALKKRKMDGAQ